MGSLDRFDSMSERPDPTPEQPQRPARVDDVDRTVHVSRSRLVQPVIPPKLGVTYRGGPHGGRGVARIPQTREVTTPLVRPRLPAPPVFVDDTGRRGRLLAWASLVFAVVVLLLIAAFWVSQVTSSSAGPTAGTCAGAATKHCGAPAGA